MHTSGFGSSAEPLHAAIVLQRPSILPLQKEDFKGLSAFEDLLNPIRETGDERRKTMGSSHY
jgi:hypothetical protein